MISDKSEEIARLNDAFRQNLSKGTLVLTQGICDNTQEDIAEIISLVRNFTDFNEDNDPYGEHETSLSFAREKRPQQRLVVRASRKMQSSVAAQFGAFDFKGQKIFWKIDYYDREFLYLSPNVSNPRVTNRVMTIMYAEEY